MVQKQIWDIMVQKPFSWCLAREAHAALAWSLLFVDVTMGPVRGKLRWWQCSVLQRSMYALFLE